MIKMVHYKHHQFLSDEFKVGPCFLIYRVPLFLTLSCQLLSDLQYGILKLPSYSDYPQHAPMLKFRTLFVDWQLLSLNGIGMVYQPLFARVRVVKNNEMNFVTSLSKLNRNISTIVLKEPR